MNLKTGYMRAIGSVLALSFVSFAPAAHASLSISPLYALVYSESNAAQVRVSTDEKRPKKYIVSWMYEAEGDVSKMNEEQRRKYMDTKILEEVISIRPKMFYMGSSRPANKVIIQENYPALEQYKMREGDLNGEYRGYIRVYADTVAPVTPKGIAETEEESLSISLQFQYSLAIPVIYRVGEVYVRGDVRDITLEKSKDGARFLKVVAGREGNAGLYGHFELQGFLSNGQKTTFGKSPNLVMTRHEDIKEYNIDLSNDGRMPIMRGKDIVLKHIPSEDTGISEPFEVTIPYEEAVNMGIVYVLNGHERFLN